MRSKQMFYMAFGSENKYYIAHGCTVDGGQDYLSHCFKGKDGFTHISIWECSKKINVNGIIEIYSGA